MSLQDPFAGRYRLQREIATSPSASVYLAEDTELGRPVALKVLGESVASDPQAAARFRNAAAAAASIRDPHVVAIYDVDAADGVPYIAMEPVDGRSLADALPNGRSVSVERATALAIGVASGLAAAHRAGVVHGGLTPHNVLLTTSGDVKLTDFGTAGSAAGSDALERAEYAAPEQLRGAPADTRSDLYGLGAILFSLVTGYPPFTGTDPVAVSERKLAGPAAPPSSRVAGVPPALDAVTARLLEPSPAARYANADEALADLRRVAVFAEPVTAVVATTDTTAMAQAAPTAMLPPLTETPAASGKTTTGPPKRRNTAIWVAVAVLVVAIGVLAWWMLASSNESDKEKVAVPAVVGQQSAAAQAAILEAGLSPSVSEVANPDFAAGLVFAQSPEAATQVPKGSVVVLKVSTGPEPTTTTTGSTTTTSSTTTSTTSATSSTTTTTTTAPPGP